MGVISVGTNHINSFPVLPAFTTRVGVSAGLSGSLRVGVSAGLSGTLGPPPTGPARLGTWYGCI